MNIIASRNHRHEDSVLTGITRKIRKLYRHVCAAVRSPVIPIDEALWQDATKHYVFIARLTQEENRRLRLMAADFLSRKNIFGADSFAVTDLMRVQIAAQACILILELGVDSYDGWSDIVIYPAQFRPRRQFTDAAGVVHTSNAALAGEAWLGGPVVLSYEDVAKANDPNHKLAGHNVVIHEFAHKLDMRNGNANGFPPLHRGMSESIWKQTFMAAYLEFCERADLANASARFDGGTALQALPLDPYASENPAEFFAVISESFFESPQAVAMTYPAVYAQLVAFYRQDPAVRPAR